jgi:hypothetical protein
MCTEYKATYTLLSKDNACKDSVSSLSPSVSAVGRLCGETFFPF